MGNKASVLKTDALTKKVDEIDAKLGDIADDFKVFQATVNANFLVASKALPLNPAPINP